MGKTPDINMKQPPKGPKHGHRKPRSKAHSYPTDGASTGSRGSNAADAIAYVAKYGSTPLDPGVVAEHLKSMQAIIDDIHKQVNQVTFLGYAIVESPPTPKPPVLPTIVTTGEILAYRTWWVDKDGRLRSMTQTDTIWEPGKPMTGDVDKFICYIRNTGKNRFAGVYAYNSSHRAFYEFTRDCIDFTGDSRIPNHLAGLALGEVKLWGQVVEHESGYRAQFAKLTKILKTHFFSQPGKDPREVYFGSTD